MSKQEYLRNFLFLFPEGTNLFAYSFVYTKHYQKIIQATILVKNNETNDKFNAKVAFVRYTERVNSS